MKKIILIFFLFSLNSLTAQVNQEWVATYNGVGTGGNYADKAAVDKFGNFIVAGRSDSITTDYVILKYSSSGNLLWSRRYDGIAHNDDWMRGMVLDDSGNIYVTGSSFEGAANGNINWLTIKYSPSGVLLWKKSLDWTLHKEDVPFSITLDKQNNLFVAGYGWAPPALYQNFDVVVAKYNGITGDEQWTRSYNSFEYIADWGYSVVTDDSGNAFVSGYAKLQNNPSLDVIATIKYDSAGNQMWVREFLRASPEYAIPMYSKIDKQNNVVVCANYNGNTDFVTIKYDSQGDLLWSRYFNGVGNNIDICRAMYIDDSSYIYICGRSEHPGTGTDLLLIKYTSEGDTSWIQYFDIGNGLSDEAFAITSDYYSNIYLTGRTTIEGDDFLTLKYSPSGLLIWKKTYSSNLENSSYGIGLDRNGNVFIAGYKYISNTLHSIVTIKYSQLTQVQIPNQIVNKYFELYQNYPNPFNPRTEIKYKLKTQGYVLLKVYNILGKEINTLVNQMQDEGTKNIYFNASNLTSGIYFYKLYFNNDLIDSKKMHLMK